MHLAEILRRMETTVRPEPAFPSPNVTGDFTNRSVELITNEGNLALGDTQNENNFEDILNFQYYAWSVVGTVLAVLGITGNILSILVLANRRMKSSTSWYLISLAILDSLVLISLVLCMSLPIVYLVTGKLEAYYKAYPYLHPVLYPLALTSQTGSIYITVGFTVERYIAVCHPLKAGKWCSKSRARRSILLIIVASIIYNIPRMLEYRVQMVANMADNTTYPQYVYTQLGASLIYRHVYFIYFHIVVLLLVPFASLTVLNALLVKSIRRSAQTEGKITHKQRRENNLTIMILSVVVVFLLCQVPSIVDNSLMATMSEDQLRRPPLVKLTCISSLMVITNSATNFYLYCVFGRKFRQVLCRMVCSYFQRLIHAVSSDKETRLPASCIKQPSVTQSTIRNTSKGNGLYCYSPTEKRQLVTYKVVFNPTNKALETSV